MSDIKLTLRRPGVPGSLTVDGVDIGRHVVAGSIAIEYSEDGPPVLAVRLAGNIHIDMPDAVLRIFEEAAE